MTHERFEKLLEGTIRWYRPVQAELAEWVEVEPRVWAEKVRRWG